MQEKRNRRKQIDSSQGSGKKNQTRQAIALEYLPGKDIVPRVIASGKGRLAQRIIERAKEREIPIHQDDQLAGTLSRLEIGDAIPQELYEVVAEILVFVDAVDKIRAKEHNRTFL